MLKWPSCTETLVRIDENQHNYSRDTSQDYLLFIHASKINSDSDSGYQAFSHSGSNYIKLFQLAIQNYQPIIPNVFIYIPQIT